MALTDLFTGLFRKKETFSSFTTDKDIQELSEGLQKLRVASENKDLTLDQIVELREALIEVSPTVDRVLEGIGENLIDVELLAIENQLEADSETAIVVGDSKKVEKSIEFIKKEKLDPKGIMKEFNEPDIVEMGEFLKLEVNSKLKKLENAEILHKGIFA